MVLGRALRLHFAAHAHGEGDGKGCNDAPLCPVWFLVGQRSEGTWSEGPMQGSRLRLIGSYLIRLAQRTANAKLREVKVLKCIFYASRGYDVNAMLDEGFRVNDAPALEDGPSAMDDAAAACHEEHDAMQVPLTCNALMIVDSSGEEEELEVLRVEDSEPEPESWPEAEKLPDDVFVKMKDRQRLLPEGSYMKFNESGVTDKAVAVLKRAAKKSKDADVMAAVEAHEAKRHGTIWAHAGDKGQDDPMGQEDEAQDDGMAQDSEAKDDGVAQHCAQDDGVAQVCAQDDGVAAQVDDSAPVASKSCAVHKAADPDLIHSQVLLRTLSELEAHEVPVPDTPLKTPDRGSEDVSTTPSTRKVLRNTSSYKAVSSPVPFLSETAFDVLMGCEDPVGAAGSSEQMVVPKVLFPAEPAGSTDEVVVETVHNNPYSRDWDPEGASKRAKETGGSIPTPQKPDTKKAKLEEQARVRHEQAQATWDNVVYVLRTDIPDAMPDDCSRNGRLCLSSNQLMHVMTRIFAHGVMRYRVNMSMSV
ncbi:unnamed protein product [Symbiodinium sp. CCMP2456]|nr:unnamed protein product [Symbiodinium sp. CCMP2456]